MTNAQMPERIWAWDDKTPMERNKSWSACDAGTGSTEYRRVDLCRASGQVQALDDMVEGATMILLGHSKDHAPGVDWSCDRQWTVNEVRQRMRRILGAVSALTPAPQAEGQDHRSFPGAADGRPLPPMGDELMIAGLNGDDARFVALQLAQNGLRLVAVTPTAQEAVPDFATSRAEAMEPKLNGETKPTGWFEFDENTGEFTGEWCSVEPACSKGFRPLYTHPPQPSVSVAEALAALEALPRSTYDCGTQWVRLEDAIVALRAYRAQMGASDE